jgi:CheY-like chemotaxis protein
VAEDDLLSQAVMRKVLSRLGLRFTLVGDGAAAVEAYAQGAVPGVRCGCANTNGLAASRFAPQAATTRC